MKKILQLTTLFSCAISFGQANLPIYESFNYATALKLVGYSTNSLVGSTGLGNWSAIPISTPVDLLAKNPSSGSNPTPGAAAVIAGWGEGATDISVGITHTPGNVVAWTPTKSLKGVLGQYFEVSYTITGRTAGSIGITFGSTTTAPSGITSSGSYNFISDDISTSKKLSILPTSEFDGTLILSIKQNGLSVDDVTIAASPTWTNNLLPAPANSAITFVGSGIDPELIFTDTTNGNLYSSFLFTADATPTTLVASTTLNTDTKYSTPTSFYSFATVSDLAVTSYTSGVLFRKNILSGKYSLGLSKSNSITECLWIPEASEFVNNSQHLIVIGYENINDGTSTNQIAKLWIDPATSSITPTPTLSQSSPTTPLSRTHIDRIKILQASSASTPIITMDEIRVANNFSYVTGGPNLGVKPVEITSKFAAYPNPVRDGKLYISSSNANEKQVSIYSILGQKVIDVKTNNNTSEINVSKLSKGNYILRISEAGKSEAKKLIIQ